MKIEDLELLLDPYARRLAVCWPRVSSRVWPLAWAAIASEWAAVSGVPLDLVEVHGPGLLAAGIVMAGGRVDGQAEEYASKIVLELLQNTEPPAAE